jgi:hypothetical protein
MRIVITGLMLCLSVTLAGCLTDGPYGQASENYSRPQNVYKRGCHGPYEICAYDSVYNRQDDNPN